MTAGEFATTGTPLRVTHVVGQLDAGGLETVVLELVRRVDRRLVQPAILCTDRASAVGAQVPRDVAVSCVRSRPGLDGRTLLRMTRQLRVSRAEIVHSHNQRPHLLATIAARMAGVPISINTRHGMHGRWLGVRGIVRRRLLAAFSDAIVVVSSAVRDVAERIDRVPAEKVRTIPNGTALAPVRHSRSEARRLLAIPGDAFVIGAVGRVAADKNHGMLLEAVQRARAELPGLHAVVLGDGPLTDYLRREAAARGLEHAFRLAGYRENAVAFLPAFDVFVQPSRTEGASLAVLEAMAAALPVIATRVGGNPEAIGEDEAGLLVPPGDAGSLAHAILVLARDGGLRARLGETGRRRAEERFSLDRMTQAYAELYLELACKRGLRA